MYRSGLSDTSGQADWGLTSAAARCSPAQAEQPHVNSFRLSSLLSCVSPLYQVYRQSYLVPQYAN